MEKKGKKNVYNGRILEIQGLPNLTVEQAFELSDASAERRAAPSICRRSPWPLPPLQRGDAALDDANGYGDVRTSSGEQPWKNGSRTHSCARRRDAEYAEVIEINMSEIPSPCGLPERSR